VNTSSVCSVEVLALGGLQLDVGRERGAAQADDAGALNGLDDLVGRGGVDVAGRAVGDLLGGGRQRLDVDAFHHLAADARRQGDPANRPRSRRMHAHRHETVRFRDGLSADHFLAFAHHHPGGFAQVLAQRHDQDRREGELPDRQAGGLVLVLRRVNPVPEGVLAQKVQHAVRRP
jgi:hypothetical protein